MAGRTDHYGLSVLQAGDSLSDDGYKYPGADRKTIDSMLYIGAEGHHHRGGLLANIPTPAAPALTRSTTGGLLPAGTRIYYKIALVSIATGQESVASPESHIDTPAAIAEPNGATLTYEITGGALLGGDYYYALSAYKGTSTSETKALGQTFIGVNSTSGLNRVRVTFPTVPAGADGFNIYRRAPGEAKFFYLTSVSTTGATPPTSFVDTGAIAENCDRSIPVANTTNSTNSITVSYPGTTPVVPSGYTWKIYRTYLNGDYNQSLLANVSAYTHEATPIITPAYTDVGLSTQSGTPLTTTPTIANPDKIVLTDASEVQGTLPMGMTAYPIELTFDFPGDTTGATTGLPVWVCEFPAATIIGCRANLGQGKTASGQVIVDVVKASSSATPTFSTIYTTTANRPKILGSQMRGARTTPDVKSLTVGDMLAANVISVAGATPVASSLTVTVYLIVSGYPATSYIPGTTTGL